MEKKIVPLSYERLPQFLIKQIGEELELDDRLNFMASSPHVLNSLKASFRKFKYMQISDDPYQSFVLKDKKQYVFSGPYLVQLLQLCTDLEHVLITANSSIGLIPENSTNCPIFESTLCHSNGYIGRFCELAPSSLLQSLKSVSLNVYLLVTSFSNLQMRCPVEDLFFSVNHLAGCSFKTFIQIDFCASTFSPNDRSINIAYLNDMNYICQKIGSKAVIDIRSNDGYADLSVEIDNLEYTFSYFYYNSNIFEANDNHEDGGFIEFDGI